MDSYEKKYKEARERAKEWSEGRYGHSVDDTPKDIAEYIFPELKESDDERIRKEILEYFQQFENEELRGVNISDWIAWIEKQSEQKVSEYDIVKTIKERIIEHFDNHLIIDKCFSIGGLKDDILKIINEVKFAKQGEQKLSEDEDREYACQSPEHYTRRELMIYNLGIVDGKRMVEDNIQKTEKIAEWSDEDKMFVHGLIRGLTAKRDIHGHTTFSSDGIDITKTINWLEFLKYRVQPQTAWWSEDDEDIYTIANNFMPEPSWNAVIETKEEGSGAFAYDYNQMVNMFKAGVNWLKSLKDKVLSQPKQEWSEEDESMWAEISDLLWEGYKQSGSKFSWDDIRNWVNPKLKSLKDRVQPKQEWSEEDERYMKDIVEWVETFIDDEDCGDMSYEEHKEFYMKRINWLKSLKDRIQPQPKQEWGKEDEYILGEVITHLKEYIRLDKENYSGEDVEYYRRDIDWLKSLKPQNWKPSAFHLECIEDAINLYEKRGINAIGLKELLEDLKKLKGE